jgi:hypothetical protein
MHGTRMQKEADICATNLANKTLKNLQLVRFELGCYVGLSEGKLSVLIICQPSRLDEWDSVPVQVLENAVCP